MHILLIPTGSHGDVHPFIAMGLALRRRGHDVTLIVHAYFEALACQVGLEAVSVGTTAQFEEALTDRDLWHPRKGLEVVANLSLQHIEPVYRAIEDRVIVGDTVLAAGSLTLAARIAQESLGVPLATVHLAPSCFWSVYQSPVFPMMRLPDRLPRILKHLFYWAADREVDRHFGPITNDFRQHLGLAPARQLLHHWWHSPQRVIGLFPPWYGPPQPDWPAQVVLTDFPLYDERDITAIPEDARRFLGDGDPPIVFTPGSANLHGRRFFEESVEACGLLGRRGILLTRHRGQVPGDLPQTVRHYDFLPLGELLPRAAALVHHGGIGTLSQGLAAATPQLVMPFGFDQHDNAHRLRRLGVGDWIRPRSYSGPRVTRVLDRLLNDPQVTSDCRQVAGKCRQDPLMEGTCRLIEALRWDETGMIAGQR